MFIATLAIVSCDSVGDDDELNHGSILMWLQFSTAAKQVSFLKDDNEFLTLIFLLELVGGNGLAVDSDLNLTLKLIRICQQQLKETHFTFATSSY